MSFSSGALFSVELGGLPRGSGYDAVNVGGSVDLGGDTTLQLSFINGFVADAGQSFVLIDAAGGLSGSLLNVADGERLAVAGGAGSFVVHYGNGTQLSLSDFQAAAVPGADDLGLDGSRPRSARLAGAPPALLISLPAQEPPLWCAQSRA